MNQHPTLLLQPEHTVPIAPSERSMHEEKVNHSWTVPVHVFQSPEGQAALAQFEPKDHSLQVTMPAIVCHQCFEKLSMDGDTRSRAIQSQSKVLNAFHISDKKFHSRADFPAACRKQLNEWMQLKKRKLDIDACKSNFFNTVCSDAELSPAAAKTPFSNMWAEEQKLDPVDAANRFFDEPRLDADILDSIKDGKKSGETARRANAHITNKAPSGPTSVDESSQESVGDPHDEDLSSVTTHLPDEPLSCDRTSFFVSWTCGAPSPGRTAILLSPTEGT